MSAVRTTDFTSAKVSAIALKTIFFKRLFEIRKYLCKQHIQSIKKGFHDIYKNVHSLFKMFSRSRIQKQKKNYSDDVALVLKDSGYLF